MKAESLKIDYIYSLQVQDQTNFIKYCLCIKTEENKKVVKDLNGVLKGREWLFSDFLFYDEKITVLELGHKNNYPEYLL